MRMFIWKYVSNITGNWHDEGGLAIIAKGDLERARQLLREDKYYVSVRNNYPDRAECEAFTKDPDIVFEGKPGEEMEEQVLIFPDAGCC